MSTQPNPLVVLSMHRSGSSVLTGCLHLLGVHLGPDLMPASQQNELGYWENENIIQIHEILLHELGCSWDMVGSLPQDWLESPAAQKAKQHLREFLRRNFAPDVAWGVKDPRMCRLLPLWEELLQEREENPGVIMIVRHPLEVANSLLRRDKIDLRKGLLLWLAYNHDAFVAGHDHPHFLVTYDQLLADPIMVLANLQKRLGITYPKPLQEAYRDILGFVRSDLKHESQRHEEDLDKLKLSNFTALYEYIRWLATSMELSRPLAMASPQLQAGAAETEDYLCFPPLVGELFAKKWDGDRWPAEERLRKEAPQLFDRLLEHIGFQERDEASLHAQRERCILTSTNVGSALFCRLYFPQEQTPVYAENRTQTRLLSQEEWQEVVFPIDNPIPLRQHGLRFDPLNTKGMISISEVRLVSTNTGDMLFRETTGEKFSRLSIQGDAFAVSQQENLTLCSFGHDPQLHLPALDVPDTPLELHVWIKAQTSQASLKGWWEQRQQELMTAYERIQSLTTAAADQKQKLAAVQKHEQDLQTAVTAKDLALAESREQLQKCTDTIARKEHALASLTEIEKRLTADLATKTKDLATAQEQIREFNLTLVSRLKELSAISDTARQAKNELQTAKNQITTLEMLLADAQKQERSDETSNQLQAELNTAREQIQFFKVSLHELQKDLENREYKLKNLQEAMEREQQTAAQQAKILEQSQKDNKAKDQLLFEQEQYVRRLQDDLQEKEQLLAQQQAERHQEIAQLQQRLDEKGKLLAEYQAALNQADQEAEERCTALEDDLKKQQELFEQGKRQLAVSQTKLLAAHDVLDRAKKSLGIQEGQTRRQALALFSAHSASTANQHAKFMVWRSDTKKADRIVKSGLFDADWYRKRYGHLLPEGQNPVEHYLRQGASLGFDPCPLFSTVYYLQNNLDVALAGENPLVHYLRGHNAKARDPHPLFSTSWYRQTSPEVRQAKSIPLVHYLTEGITLGLQPHPLFDPAWYVAKYLAEDDRHMPALVHYVLYGLDRGYDPGPLFNGVWYKTAYPAVVDYHMPPILYYLRYGQKEGHSPGPDFNPAWYLEHYTDVAQAGLDPLVHYLRYGHKEGRRGVSPQE